MTRGHYQDEQEIKRLTYPSGLSSKYQLEAFILVIRKKRKVKKLIMNLVEFQNWKAFENLFEIANGLIFILKFLKICFNTNKPKKKVKNSE